jgi:hypothetical protein
MICKERDKREHPETDKFSKAGADAENQMAFYLRRAFGHDPEVRVFHDLRYVDQRDEAVQIDHLLLHPLCIIVIESKSVTSEVRVNKHKEWTRVWNGRESGMPSPVLQSQRQADRLREILNSYADELRAGQLRFDATPLKVLVAISDSGIIRRDIDLPEVGKADQVPSRAAEVIQRCKSAAASLQYGADLLTDTEIQNITNFLLKYHNPLKPAKPTTPVAPQPESYEAYMKSTAPTPAGLGRCEKCSTQCEILWGHNYYWKCPICQATMAIKEYCPTCKGKTKLRKDKKRFYKYCESCKTPEELYFNGK